MITDPHPLIPIHGSLHEQISLLWQSLPHGIVSSCTSISRMPPRNHQSVVSSLRFGWESACKRRSDGTSLDLSLIPSNILADAELLMIEGSSPERVMALAIAFGTVIDPNSNPCALQAEAGVDRRGQASAIGEVLVELLDEAGYTVKISRDPGVSNQFREPEINAQWLKTRRSPNAKRFVAVAGWLQSFNPEERSERASVLANVLIDALLNIGESETFKYPQFHATPRIAMIIVKRYLETTPNRPDATEAVVTAAIRVLGLMMLDPPIVERGDIHSPEHIDITLRWTNYLSGVEVTDDPITMIKITQEVVPAMQNYGLNNVTVIGRKPSSNEVEGINAYAANAFQRFGQQINMSVIDDLETWFNMPVIRGDVGGKFLSEIGEELDRFSEIQTRMAWLKVLNSYIDSVNNNTDFV